MRILVVNVNTTESITEAIGKQAQAAASPGTEIVALTPRLGAESVEGNFESHLAAVAVMDAVRTQRNRSTRSSRPASASTAAKGCRSW